MKKSIIAGVCGVVTSLGVVCLIKNLVLKNDSTDLSDRVDEQFDDDYAIPALINNIEVDSKEFKRIFGVDVSVIPKYRLNDVDLLDEFDSTLIHCIVVDDDHDMYRLLKSDYKFMFNKDIPNCENNEELLKIIEKSFVADIDLVTLYLNGISYQKIKAIYSTVIKNNSKESV